ncbi:MAG: 4-hydroxy-tetrahydrodipicolinate synthase [Candidatus Borkfalkiaceae bacterium]|nr:4-hydroxy-tetrahydrodipicolinate synthase [Clostridia bacterium]MDY6223734.1 4-hydroxy-tetrahydrodipicolinate synthase [Christensenellaceae bacterium]
MKRFFRGVGTALITPFTEKGVDFACLERLIERQINGGADALIVLGTTGEPAAMTEKEKRAVMEFSVKTVKKHAAENGAENDAAVHIGAEEFPRNAQKRRVKLIFGCGSNCTATAVKNARLAEELGADGLLAVTPYYNKCTQNGLYLYYKAICEAVHIPVIAYAVPSRTGVNLTSETMAKISELPNMAGLKDARGNMAQTLETMRRTRKNCDVYSGEDSLNLPVLLSGGAGVISVVSNLTPRAVKAMYLAAERGDLAEAIKINDLLAPLTAACFCEVNPIPVKAALNALGYFCGTPRAPLTPLEKAHEALIKNAVAEAGKKAQDENICGGEIF